MVNFFSDIPLISFSPPKRGIRGHVEKEIWKNINHKSLQPPSRVHPPHLHDLEGVDILSSGCGWNFFEISFCRGLGHINACLLDIIRSYHQNYTIPIKISFSSYCFLGQLRAISRLPLRRSRLWWPSRKPGIGDILLLQYSNGVSQHMLGPLPPPHCTRHMYIAPNLLQF